MKILSLFDGISCARVALERAGIKVEKYYASEVDKYAIQISQKNYPDIVQLGDVKDLCTAEGLTKFLPDIDLMIGGSPCQDLSIAKNNRQGLAGSRSNLFYNYVLILKYVKPKYFILENVASMPKEAKQVITKTLGVEPIMIDAALFSAQNRQRLFWTNIPNISLPEKNSPLMVVDILENNVDEKYYTNMDFTNRIDYKIHKNPYEKKAVALRATDYKGTHNIIAVEVFNQGKSVGKSVGKSTTLMARDYKGFGNQKMTGVLTKRIGTLGKKAGLYQNGDYRLRRLTPIECERLQCLPDKYTQGISNTQRYKALGNGFNVDVVAHILSFIPDRNML